MNGSRSSVALRIIESQKRESEEDDGNGGERGEWLLDDVEQGETGTGPRESCLQPRSCPIRENLEWTIHSVESVLKVIVLTRLRNTG